MKPPRLISVSGTAFGSFASGFELKLPETGLVHLQGENLDTKGSSASGKSTLIHAINYPNGTCPVPMTALQSWYTKEAPKVVNTYDVNGKIVKISRGKKLELEIDGVRFLGGADQKEGEIDRLFGIDAEMRSALTYREQGSSGLFLGKSNSEKNAFLTALLNLNQWEVEQKKSGVKVKELEERCLVLNARLSDLRTRLDTLEAMGDGAEAEASLAQVTQDIATIEARQRKYEKTIKDARHDAEIVYQFSLDLFKPHIEEASKFIEYMESITVDAPKMTAEWEKLKALQVTVQTRIDRLVGEDLERTKVLLAEAEVLRDQWQALSLQAAGAHRLLADRDRVVSDMAALSRNVCPTCSREWEEARVRLEDLKIELEQINGEVEELKFVKEEADRTKDEYDAYPKSIEPNPMIAQMRAALEKCKLDVVEEEKKATAGAKDKIVEHSKALRAAREAKQKLEHEAREAATKRHAEVLAGISGLEELARQETNAKFQLEYARQQLATEVGAVRERRRQIEEGKKNVTGILDELAPLQVELNKEKDFVHLTSREGFRGSVFDEALEAISAETNEMLASIANTRNCTLEFKSEKETQDGKLRQEIVPVVTINGHETTLKFGPSGGMHSAINLAVDLAVGKIVSERTGVCPGWLILDESFDGLGPREKETCLEILQLYAHDRLIIVVDHMSETQGLFTQKITVQSRNGVSVLA